MKLIKLRKRTQKYEWIPFFSRIESSRWIPCTERLPEKSGRYLVTRGSNVCDSLWNKVDILNYSDLMGLKKEKIWWSGDVGKIDFEKCDHVIAWMPLPDPYKTDVRINFSKFSNFGLINALREEFGYVKRSDCFGCEDETTENDTTVPAHWIDQGHKIFKCSHCGNYLDFRGVNAGRGTANYCPNCGAKMWNILTKKPKKLTKRYDDFFGEPYKEPDPEDDEIWMKQAKSLER